MLRFIFGACLVLTPFAIMNGIMIAHMGWLGAAAIWATIGLIYGCLWLGFRLLDTETR